MKPKDPAGRDLGAAIIHAMKARERCSKGWWIR